MGTPSPSSGRRANGLPSADWGALVDLDPRLSEALLTRLAEAGVAAYVEPAVGVDGLFRAVLLPGRPMDRLWVDPACANAARQVVGAEVADLTALLTEQDPQATASGLVLAVPRGAVPRVLAPPPLPEPPSQPKSASLPEPPSQQPEPPSQPEPPTLPAPPAAGALTSDTPSPDSDDDAVFRQIVADYERDDVGPVPPWPTSEDLDEPTSPPRLPRPVLHRRVDPPVPPGEDLPAWLEPEALEDDGHYEPPPPPPVPRLRARTVGAVAAVLVGLILLFRPSLVGLFPSGGVDLLGLLLVLGGAGGLVWWMRDASPDDPDEGAVV